jgi:hypothetical protein
VRLNTDYNELPRGDLKEKLSKEEFMAKEQAIYDSLVDRPKVQEDFKNKFWGPFMEHYQDGDEIWTFSSPDMHWQMLMGRAGNAILRNGECVYYQVTEIN